MDLFRELFVLLDSDESIIGNGRDRSLHIHFDRSLLKYSL